MTQFNTFTFSKLFIAPNVTVHNFTFHLNVPMYLENTEIVIYSRTKFGNYNIVQPCQVSPLKHVPSHIKTPPYYTSGEPIKHITAPEIKNDVQIAMMKNSCCLAAEILRKIGDYIQVMSFHTHTWSRDKKCVVGGKNYG